MGAVQSFVPMNFDSWFVQAPASPAASFYFVLFDVGIEVMKIRQGVRVNCDTKWFAGTLRALIT